MLEYNPTEVSQQAYELGLGNIQRSREGEQLTDPFAAEMRAGMSEQIAKATDENALEDFMTRFARERGITSVAKTGIDPSSTIGRSALFDQTTEAGRNMMLDNIAKRQQFLQANAAPVGGIDPGASVAAQQAVRDANTGTMNAFQAQNLQNIFGMGQSYSDYVNKMMGETLSANQAEQANLRGYQKDLINNLIDQTNAQNAANAARYRGEQEIEASKLLGDRQMAAARSSGRQAMTGTIVGGGLAAGGTIAAAVLI
jgi:hypothetical protein